MFSSMPFKMLRKVVCITSLLGIFVCLLWIWGMMELGFDREPFRFLTVLIPLKLVLTGKSRQLNKINSKRSFLL